MLQSVQWCIGERNNLSLQQASLLLSLRIKQKQEFPASQLLPNSFPVPGTWKHKGPTLFFPFSLIKVSILDGLHKKVGWECTAGKRVKPIFLAALRSLKLVRSRWWWHLFVPILSSPAHLLLSFRSVKHFCNEKNNFFLPPGPFKAF